MEPIAMAFAVGLGAMPSIQPMSLTECDIKAAADRQTLCVLIAPPCGGVGEEICTDDIKPKSKYRKAARKKVVAKRRPTRTAMRTRTTTTRRR